MNKCQIGPGKRGFCGLVANIDGRLIRFGGTPERGILEWYYDPLPTNCVAWWFCAGCTGLGYPKYAYKPGAEVGYSNLAVFYGACLPGYEKLFAIIDDKLTIIRIDKLVRGILQEDSADEVSFGPFILSRPRAPIRVAGLDDNCKIKYALVSRVSKRWFDGQLIKITLEMGHTLHVTPDHPMLVLQQNKLAIVNADRLDLRDYVPIAKRLPDPTQNVDESDLAEFKAKGSDHKVITHFPKIYSQRTCIQRLKERQSFQTKFPASLMEGDVHLIKVKRIDSIPYEGYVYDLEVNDPSSPLATYMLASGVITHNCSFDCLFCQNWHYRALSSKLQPVISAESLAAKAHRRVSCVCYFGGDPSPQMPHALRTSEIALEKAREEGRLLRICWESNGYMSEVFTERAARLSFESGGTVKFDIKTFDETLNQVLCGVSNKPTLENFRRIGEKFFRERLELPVLTASTLLIPGYIDAEEVGQIANFLADIDSKIPYTLLAFYPQYIMCDLPTTSRQLAYQCLEAAKKAGLEQVRIGNVHLLS
jgi:pyruvate-formate lyase-activating enzyme